MSEDGLARGILDGLVEAIEQRSLPRKYAALENGVSPSTFELWVAMGETGQGGPLHEELARRVHKAEASKVGKAMTGLEAMASEDPKAAESFLKLFKPGDFGGVKPDPDSFDDPQRKATRQDMLLDNPPPAMRAKLTAHRYLRLPEGMSAEDRALIDALIDKYNAAPLPALPEKAT